MIVVVIVCEGQTEEGFVREILRDDLASRGILVCPRLINTSPVSKGGALSRDRVVRFCHCTLHEQSDTYVSTFFDLYGLPSDFPGRAEGAGCTDPLARATAVEKGLHQAIVEEAGCRPDRFLPHIQPFEFESLLFSDTNWFAKTNPAWQAFGVQLETARKEANSPEHINGGSGTHPSARLKVLQPRYKKVLDGLAAAECIGLPTMRQQCLHFDLWLTRLEELPPLGKQK